MLPTTRNEPNAAAARITILGINISYLPAPVQFCALCSAVFLFYVTYGYVQESIFRIDGMQPFGWYLTLLQFWIYTALAYSEMKLSTGVRRRIPKRIYLQIAFYTVATMGLSNASIGYLNYPTHVIFKCCKLIPVLIGGVLIQGKRYGLMDVLAACLMSVGLILFSLADSQVSPNFDSRGYTMISLALVADAVIGNVQEKAMKGYGASNSEMVLYSYSIGSLYILFGLVVTGELFSATAFFMENPVQTYGYALVFGVLGYLGVSAVLLLIRTYGALVAVTVTTLRKAITIVFSFLLFSKPFTSAYAWAGLCVLAAIYLNVYSKNRDAFRIRIPSCVFRIPVFWRWSRRPVFHGNSKLAMSIKVL